MCITIHRHDARWKGCTPLVRKAARGGMSAQGLSFPRTPSFQRTLTRKRGEAKSSAERLRRENFSLLDWLRNANRLSNESSLRWNDGVRGNDGAPSNGGNDNTSLTILLSNDAEVQALNKQYRGKDKPTNVLSFPDGDVGEDGVLQLGDMVLAYETVAREAVEQSKSFEAHLTHLVIHGVLHLLGYDHEEDVEAEAMEALEIALLARMGIANPYQ